MSELVLLCNEQEIYCNSVAYYCDGSVVKLDISYDTTTFSDVTYDTLYYTDVDYTDWWFLLDEDLKFLLDSNGLFLRCKGQTEQINIRY